jgi:hypothetical protein
MMRSHVLALLLLAGCAATPPVNTGNPPRDELKVILDSASNTVDGARTLVGIICQRDGDESEVCQTLRHSLLVLSLVVSDSKQLYATYKKTGEGLELVLRSIERLQLAPEAFDRDSELARMVIDGSSDSVPLADCGGGAVCVAQPPGDKATSPDASAGGATNPYREQLPPAKAR